MLLEARSEFARVEGTTLHWTEIGRTSDRPPVVLLHGLADCHLTWGSIASRIACDRRVLMPDLPGHGLSERVDASYELGWYAHVVARWIEALGLDQVDLVGHSYGGGVSQVLLLECRPRIRRLALVAAGGLGSEIAFGLRLASTPWVVEHWGQPFMGLFTRLAFSLSSKAISTKYIAQLCAMNTQPGSARAFARTVRDIINWRGQRRSFFARASEVGGLPPIGVFWGKRDAIIPVVHALAFTQAVEGVQLNLFDRCGHRPHHETPDLFLRALREFLDEPSPPCARLRKELWVDPEAKARCVPTGKETPAYCGRYCPS